MLVLLKLVNVSVRGFQVQDLVYLLFKESCEYPIGINIKVVHHSKTYTSVWAVFCKRFLFW